MFYPPPPPHGSLGAVTKTRWFSLTILFLVLINTILLVLSADAGADGKAAEAYAIGQSRGAQVPLTPFLLFMLVHRRLIQLFYRPTAQWRPSSSRSLCLRALSR